MSAKIVRLREIDGLIYASSLDVARDFGREHKHVLRDVDEIMRNIGPSVDRSWFRPGEFFDRYNRRQRCVDLSEQGWQLVIMNVLGMLEWKIAYIKEYARMREALAGAVKVVRLPPRRQSQFDFEQKTQLWRPDGRLREEFDSAVWGSDGRLRADFVDDDE
jgi:Rha family phage regulatory protein